MHTIVHNQLNRSPFLTAHASVVPRRACVILLVTAVLSVAPATGNADAISEPEFLAEYSTALEILEQQCSNLAVEVRVDRRDFPVRARYFIKGPAMQRVAEYESANPPPSGVGRVYSLSPDSAFHLTADTTGGPYVLRGFGDTVRDDLGLRLDIVEKWKVLPVTHVYGLSMRRLIESEEIRLVSVERVTGEADATVMTRFFVSGVQSEFYAPGAEIPAEAPEMGSHVAVWLLPERGWVVKEYEIVSDPMWVHDGREQEVTYHVMLDYSNPPSTEPLFPSRIDYRLVNRLSDGEVIEDVQTVYIEAVTSGNVTDEQFTLSHFGLPELVSGDSTGRTVVWIIVINAVLFLACAAYLVRTRRNAHQN